MSIRNKIKSINKNINKKIRNASPWLMSIYFFFLDLAKLRYYKNERKLMKGKLKSQSEQPSIIFFTVHKCASTFIRDTLEKLSDGTGMQTINYSGLFNEAQQKKHYHDPTFVNRVFKKNGFLYGAFRQYYPFDPKGEIKILLVLRDPRDVLTSHYFSTAFNHPLVEKEFLEKRKKAQAQTIDEYVLEKLPIFKERYEKYISEILGKPNVMFVKYEEMVEDFSSWIQKVASFAGLAGNSQRINDIIAETSFEVKSENPNEFKRSVKAGDHLRKLQPATIDILNRELGVALKALNY